MWSGNTYQNDWLQLKFTLPEGWCALTYEELADEYEIAWDFNTWVEEKEAYYSQYGRVAYNDGSGSISDMQNISTVIDIHCVTDNKDAIILYYHPIDNLLEKQLDAMGSDVNELTAQQIAMMRAQYNAALFIDVFIESNTEATSDLSASFEKGSRIIAEKNFVSCVCKVTNPENGKTSYTERYAMRTHDALVIFDLVYREEMRDEVYAILDSMTSIG